MFFCNVVMLWLKNCASDWRCWAFTPVILLPAAGQCLLRGARHEGLKEGEWGMEGRKGKEAIRDCLGVGERDKETGAESRGWNFRAYWNINDNLNFQEAFICICFLWWFNCLNVSLPLYCLRVREICCLFLSSFSKCCLASLIYFVYILIFYMFVLQFLWLYILVCVIGE